MTDQKETATTTMWQDNHSGKRGHQLMTRKLADAIPDLGANANVADCDTSSPRRNFWDSGRILPDGA